MKSLLHSGPLPPRMVPAIPVFSETFVACAGLAFVGVSKQLVFSERIAAQAPVLFALLALVTLAPVLNEGLVYRSFFLFAKYILLFILGYGMGGEIGVEMLLLVSAVIDAVFFLPPLAGLSVGLAMPIVSALARGPAIAWGESSPAPEAAARILLAAIPAAAGCLLFLFRLSLRREYEQTKTIERLNGTLTALSEANRGFQAYAVNAESRAVLNERNRITRDIHDTVGHALTNIIALSRLAARTVAVEPLRTAEALGQIGQQAQEGISEMRVALRTLRAMESGPETGLRAVHKLVSAFESSTGIRVSADYANVAWKPGTTIDDIILHTLQEGLTNAFRHGHADEIGILFWRGDDGVTVTVRDNGSCEGDIKLGLGLTGMKERIEQVSGRLQVYARPDGFTLQVFLPRTALDG